MHPIVLIFGIAGPPMIKFVLQNTRPPDLPMINIPPFLSFDIQSSGWDLREETHTERQTTQKKDHVSGKGPAHAGMKNAHTVLKMERTYKTILTAFYIFHPKKGDFIFILHVVFSI